MKKVYSIFSIGFFFLLTALTLLTVFIPDKKYSESENRDLAQKPPLNINSISDGKFQSGLGDYLSDQFPLRESMIKINTFISKLSGVKNLNGAYEGKDGFYFEVVTDDDINKEDYVKNLNAIKFFSEKYPDINVNAILVPTSSVIYSEKLPYGANIYNSDSLFKEAKDVLGDELFIDVRDSLKNNKDEYIFYKTDHHWTSKGAYLAYVDFCKATNQEARTEDDFGFNFVTTEFYGSLHSKNLDYAAKPDSISIANNTGVCNVIANGNDISIYALDKLEKKDKYLIFFGDNYGETIINTECKNGKTLLVIKDSFANSFVPLLTKNYEKIIMIDQRYNNTRQFSKLINKYNVTDTLFMYEITNVSIQTHLATACKN